MTQYIYISHFKLMCLVAVFFFNVGFKSFISKFQDFRTQIFICYIFWKYLSSVLYFHHFSFFNLFLSVILFTVYTLLYCFMNLSVLQSYFPVFSPETLNLCFIFMSLIRETICPILPNRLSNVLEFILDTSLQD